MAEDDLDTLPPLDEIEVDRAQETPASRRWLRGIFVAWLTFHAASMAYVLLPASHARTLLEPIFHRYQAATGTEQHWDMFSSVSNHYRYEVSLEVRSPGGVIERFGPILPGLEKTPDYFRYHTFFTRIDSDRFAGYLGPYAENLKAELIETGVSGTTFELRKSAQRIRFLESIRSTGTIGFDETAINGPYPLDPPPQ